MIDCEWGTRLDRCISWWVVITHSINTPMGFSMSIVKHALQTLTSQALLSKHNFKMVSTQVIVRSRDQHLKPQCLKCTRTQWGNYRRSVTSHQQKLERKSKKRCALKTSNLAIDRKAQMLNAYKKSKFMNRNLRSTSMKQSQSIGTWFNDRMNWGECPTTFI
jgi:hypothetical protein